MKKSQLTRKHILETAFWEFFQHGFNGVSINEIVAKTKVTKGALFHYFPTKNDLGYAVVDEVITELTLNRWIRPLDKYENAIEGILQQLKLMIENTPNEKFALGCPLNNLIQEMSFSDPVFREKLAAVLELWISEIDKHLQRGQKNGYIKKSVNTRQVAEFVVMAHEGAFGMSKGLADKSIFWSLYRSLEMYLHSVSTNN